jgi:hypothetical protein
VVVGNREGHHMRERNFPAPVRLDYYEADPRQFEALLYNRFRHAEPWRDIRPGAWRPRRARGGFMTAEPNSHSLKVVLDLKWVQGNEFDAKVSVTVTDSCYREGDIKMGLPPGQVGIPEVEYVTFRFPPRSRN